MTKQKYFQHIENYKEDELVKKVLNSETSFIKEVESFYDIHFNLPGRNIGNDCAYKSKKGKEGEIPSSLLNLLEPFCESKFNHSLMNYEQIRKQAKDASNSGGPLVLGWGLASFGIGGALFSQLPEVPNPELGLSIGLGLGLAGILYMIKSIRKGNKESKNPTPEDQEYSKLKRTTLHADYFMEDYRDYLRLNKCFKGEK